MTAAALARPCVFCRTDHTGPAVFCSPECAELAMVESIGREVMSMRVTPLQGHILSRIAIGESPYIGGGATKAETERELARLRRLGCWRWKDPTFPVMREIMPFGQYLLAGYL